MTGLRIFGAVKTSPLEASDAPMPTLHGIYWLKRNPNTDNLLRFIKWVSYLVPIVTLLLFASMYFLLGMDRPENLSAAKQEKLEELKVLSLLLIIGLGGMPIMVAFALGNMRRLLGTDGHRLYVRMNDGTQVSFAPEQAVYGARQIRYRDFTIGVKTGHGHSLYAEGELETYIAPLLKRAKKLGPLALVRHELSHPDRLTIFVIVYLGVLTALLVVTGLWEKILFPER